MHGFSFLAMYAKLMIVCITRELRHSRGGSAHLKDTHPKGVSKNFVSVMVVAVSDVCGSHKQGEWVLLVHIQ